MLNPKRSLLVRLAVLGTLSWLGWPGAGLAQDKPLRVGLLAFGNSDMSGHLRQTLIEALRERGYVEGRNLLLVRGYAEGRPAGVAEIANEFAALNLDMVVTTCTPTTNAMRKATRTTALVMAAASDPVGQGLIASYRRPGGNITGVASQFEDVAAKMLQLLVDTVPKASPVAVAFNPRNPVHRVFLREMEASAPLLKVSVVPVEIGREDDIAAKLDGAASEQFASLMVLPDDPFLTHLRRQLVAVAAKRRMPSFFGVNEAVEDGGLMSYGQPLSDAYFRAAYYVDRIAKGAKPAELPVEQPSRFLLVVNKKTARALGLAIPQSVLLRADRVIE